MNIHSGQPKSGPWLLEASRHEAADDGWQRADWRNAPDYGAFNSTSRPPTSADIPHPSQLKLSKSAAARVAASQDPENDPYGVLNGSGKTFEDLVNNVVSHHDKANEGTNYEGRVWYPAAHEYTKDLAQKTSGNHNRVAAEFASLSPQNDWDSNIEHGTHFALHYNGDPNFTMPRILPANVEKAMALRQADPSQYDAILNGPKTRSFYHNIIDSTPLRQGRPGEHDDEGYFQHGINPHTNEEDWRLNPDQDVTADTHHARAASTPHGADLADARYQAPADFGYGAASGGTKYEPGYDLYNRATQEATRRVNAAQPDTARHLTPKQMQAIVWTKFKEDVDNAGSGQDFNEPGVPTKGLQKALDKGKTEEEWAQKNPLSNPLPRYQRERDPDYWTDEYRRPHPDIRSAPGYLRASAVANNGSLWGKVLGSYIAKYPQHPEATAGPQHGPHPAPRRTLAPRKPRRPRKSSWYKSAKGDVNSYWDWYQDQHHAGTSPEALYDFAQWHNRHIDPNSNKQDVYNQARDRAHQTGDTSWTKNWDHTFGPEDEDGYSEWTGHGDGRTDPVKWYDQVGPPDKPKSSGGIGTFGPEGEMHFQPNPITLPEGHNAEDWDPDQKQDPFDPRLMGASRHPKQSSWYVTADFGLMTGPSFGNAFAGTFGNGYSSGTGGAWAAQHAPEFVHGWGGGGAGSGGGAGGGGMSGGPSATPSSSSSSSSTPSSSAPVGASSVNDPNGVNTPGIGTSKPPGASGSQPAAPVTKGSGLDAATQMAQGANGMKYDWGGHGPGTGSMGSYDCSGFQSAIYNSLTGKNERFVTDSNFKNLGFQPGYDPNSKFNIGTYGSGENGHMVGQLNGVKVESNGSGGVQYGGKATGPLDSPHFSNGLYHLPDSMIVNSQPDTGTAHVGRRWYITADDKDEDETVPEVSTTTSGNPGTGTPVAAPGSSPSVAPSAATPMGNGQLGVLPSVPQVNWGNMPDVKMGPIAAPNHPIPSGSAGGGGHAPASSGASGGAPSAAPSSAVAPSSAMPGPGGVPLVQRPNGTWTSSDPAWAHLIDRESGGRPSVGQGITDANGGPGSPNAAQGLFQFTPKTWAGAGGGKYGPNPGQATPQQQAEVAGNLLRSNPSGGDWGAGRPGREDAGALARGLGPKAGSIHSGQYKSGPYLLEASRHYAIPGAADRANWMMDRQWDTQSHSPAELRQRHLKDIKNDPESKTDWASRPKDSEFSSKERLPQQTLPGMEKIRGEEGRLMRGVPIDTTKPEFRRVWQMTHGQGQPVDDPGMFPDANLRYEDRGGKFDHPGLADAIVEGLGRGGAGEHWTSDYDVADNYGWGSGEGSESSGDWRNNEELPVFMDADWNGRGENYSRAGSGNVDHEKEIMLNRGAPLKLRDLKIPQGPGEEGYEDYDEWNPILNDSRDITAAWWFTADDGDVHDDPLIGNTHTPKHRQDDMQDQEFTASRWYV